jgi:hypothetical protein
MTLDVQSELVLDGELFQRLEQLIADLRLDRNDFVIFGSAPLLAHGLRGEIHDLDIVARGTTWERARSHGSPATGSENGALIATFFDGLIQFSEGWISDAWDAERLIDRAEFVHGLPFAHLEDVLEYKQVLNRPKDLSDIRILQTSLQKKNASGPAVVTPRTSLWRFFRYTWIRACQLTASLLGMGHRPSSLR